MLYPPIELDRYRTTRTNPTFVTFFNPIASKGLEIVLQVAALLPHRQFQLVEVARLEGAPLLSLRERLVSLPNVTLCRAAPDVRPFYSRTVLLLTPSQVAEGFGRVVVEAQASGIPCIARDVGGLGEAVGAGGILLPASAEPAEWAEAVESVLGSEDVLRTLSAAATLNVSRPEFSLDHHVRQFLELAESHIGSGRQRASA